MAVGPWEMQVYIPYELGDGFERDTNHKPMIFCVAPASHVLGALCLVP